MKRALVVEINDKHMIVIDNKGRFKKVKNKIGIAFKYFINNLLLDNIKSKIIITKRKILILIILEITFICRIGL